MGRCPWEGDSGVRADAGEGESWGAGVKGVEVLGRNSRSTEALQPFQPQK